MGGRNLEFPNRKDYLDWLISNELIQTDQDLIESPDIIAAVHQDWHHREQNGCMFAKLLSLDPAAHGWKRRVFTRGGSDQFPPESYHKMETALKEYMRDKNVQAVSLIFPDISDEVALTDLLKGIEAHTNWTVEVLDEIIEVTVQPQLIGIKLRVQLLKKGVLAWPLGFGPFPFLAITRQAPFTEIVLVVKPKQLPLRPNITPSLNQAHLADMHVPVLNDEAWKHVWSSTESQKRKVLGDYGDARAKAKLTFALPANLWSS